MHSQPSVVRLANDIASQFEHKPHDVAVESIARHINLFWDPRMRRELAEIADDYHAELHVVVLDVIPKLHISAGTPL